MNNIKLASVIMISTIRAYKANPYASVQEIETQLQVIIDLLNKERPEDIRSKARSAKLCYELNRALAVIRSPQSFEIEDVCADIEKVLKTTGGFICAEWQHVSEWKNGKQLVARCDLDQKHEGRHEDSVIAISWENASPIHVLTD